MLILALAWIGVRAQEPPQGWRVATPDALSGEPIRRNPPVDNMEAEADFDGDGEVDRAAIFVADDGAREALFVALSTAARGGWRMAAEMEHRNPSMTPVMGISVAPAGRYRTACGKAYWECRPGEPAELELERAGVSWFRFESAASIVYWDQASQEFVQVWVSD